MTIALMCCAVGPALVVLWYCICSANEMSGNTPHGARLAVTLIAAGAFAEIMLVIDGRTPDASEILLLTGLMILFRSNCRRGVCPCVTVPTWPERRKDSR